MITVQRCIKWDGRDAGKGTKKVESASKLQELGPGARGPKTWMTARAGDPLRTAAVATARASATWPAGCHLLLCCAWLGAGAAAAELRRRRRICQFAWQS